MSNLISPAAAEYQLRHIHDSRVPETIASMAVCLPAAYIAIFLRFTSRRVGKIPWKLDDWLLVAGLASILLLYRRIFTNGCFKPSFNVILWCTGAFVLSYSTCQAMLTLLYCTPIQALRDHRIGTKCINFDRALVVLSSLNIGTDILIPCLPVPQLWRLVRTRRRKYQLEGIFFLGGFVCVASIVRVPYIVHISLVDQTWSDIDGCIWFVVELCLGIVSACLPTLRPLFIRLFRGGRAANPVCENADRKVVKHAEDEVPDKISVTEPKAAEAV